jgi:hypothetical protein
MIKQILDFELQTINWFEDKIIDWANAGTLNFEFTESRVDFTGPIAKILFKLIK